MFFEVLILVIIGAIIFYAKKCRPKASKISSLHRKTPGTENHPIKEILNDGRLYDVTNWVEKHPGGGVINFYVNNDEDATIAISQFHNRSSRQFSAFMSCLKSRHLEEKLQRPTMQLKYEELTEDFYKLFNEITAEGLFNPSFIHVALRILELIFLGSMGGYVVWRSQSMMATATGIFILHWFQSRAQSLVHEAGHYSLTGKPRVDRVLQSLLYALSVGLSGSWWNNHHNRHHAMPQRVHYDVDLNTLPLIAFNVAVTKDKPGKPNFLVRHQAKLLVPVSAFLGILIWKVYLHPRYSIVKKHYHELAFMALHYYVAYNVGLIIYMTVTIINAPYVFTNVFVSHTHLPVTEESRHWVEYSAVHTTNVNPSWWCDYVMSYLNYQIEHHLFPTLPSFRLARISKRVKALFEKHDLPYNCTSYGTAFAKIFQNLSAVSTALLKN